MATVKDYYKVLGCSPNADPVVIRAAWRALLTKYHPDIDPSEEAARKLALINEAWGVLGSPESRALYDASRPVAEAPKRPAEQPIRPAASPQPSYAPHAATAARDGGDYHPPHRWRASSAVAVLGTAILGTIATATALAMMYSPEGVSGLVGSGWFAHPAVVEPGTPSLDQRRRAMLRAEIQRRQSAAEAAGRPEVVAESCFYVGGEDAATDAREVCPRLGMVAECVDGRGTCRARP